MIEVVRNRETKTSRLPPCRVNHDYKLFTSIRTQVEKAQLVLPPDTAILIEARIKAGEKALQIKTIGNLLLHDPVLTLEFLQLSNSVMFGGSTVSDLDAAITRIGSARLIETLGQFNTRSAHEDSDVLEGFEILRYNCRRISIVSLMCAAVLRPALANLARMAGLFGDVGHLLALNKLGSKYVAAAKTTRRKALGFRLEKDFKFNIDKELVKFLLSKGLPRNLVIPYQLDEAPKSPTESDLRLLVQSALELIDAYDSGKIENYGPGKALPSQSNLRPLKILPAQQEKLIKAVSDYLKTVAEAEAPEGTSLFISSLDEEPEVAPSEGIDTLRIPPYTNTSVKPKSREALQDYFDLCEQEKDPELLTCKAARFLRESGMFERTALVRVSKGINSAKVEFAAGMPVNPGDPIPCGDVDSPFNILHLEIKSANVSAGKAKAPFGVTAYAMGAVDILPNGDRILLYADKTESKSLPMESRHVFRLSFGLLMRSIQSLRPAE